MENYFTNLRGMEAPVEKKGPQKLNYISWADAWDMLKKFDETVNFKVYQNNDGLPYFSDSCGGLVKVGVTVKDIEHIVWLPIMDYANKSIPKDKINSFDVAKAIQRAMAKAIAMHGLGLYVYRGEDFPEENEIAQVETETVTDSKTIDKYKCINCNEIVNKVVQDYSSRHFQGKTLCKKCQDIVRTVK